MKWGVRRTRKQIDRDSKRRMDKMLKSKTVIATHKPSPRRSTPNSIIDRMSHNGVIEARTFYNNRGVKRKDIHTTDHGNPKWHNFDSKGGHVVLYEWNSDGSLKKKTRRKLSERERRENSDIL